MTTRIGKRDLRAVVDRINRVTGSPAEPWTRTPEGKLVANIGNYHLSGAYGGHALHRMVNEHGGVSDIFYGHGPARDLYEKMQAFLRGYEAGSKGNA